MTDLQKYVSEIKLIVTIQDLVRTMNQELEKLIDECTLSVTSVNSECTLHHLSIQRVP